MFRNKNRLARAGADKTGGDNMYELDYLMISLVMNDEQIDFIEENSRIQMSSPLHAFFVLLVRLGYIIAYQSYKCVTVRFAVLVYRGCSLSGLNGRNSERLPRAPKMALTEQPHPPPSNTSIGIGSR